MIVQRVVLAFVSVAAAFANAAAQEARPSVLTGVIIDSAQAQPVVGATITIADLRKTATSDTKGEFIVSDIASGTHVVSVRRLGFRPVELRLRFTGGDTVDRRIILSGSATVLDSVKVKAASASGIPSFDENRALGLGHFLTRAELAKYGETRFSAVLASVPSVGLVQGRTGQAWIISKHMTPSLCSGKRTQTVDRADGKDDCLNGQGIYTPGNFERLQGMQAACYAQVYLDGLLMNNTRPTEPFDVNQIPIANIEAVEYYAGPSETPLKYSGLDSRCGVLVIWTRRS